MIFLGSIVNAIGIAVGALIGVLVSGLLAKHKRLSEIPDAIMKGMGLCVIFIGVSGVITNQQRARETLGS